MGRVIVVGSINVDLVVTADRLPAPGETVIGGRFSQHHGGKGGNQAVAAARLGADVRFVGAVGDDPFGEQARAALAAEGIDLAELRTLPGEATGVALILVDARGENSIAVASGANAAVTEAHVEAAFAAIRPGVGDVVLVGHEVRTVSAQTALTLGRAAGATTILNPAPATGLTTATLAEADIVTPNDGELDVLALTVGGVGGSDAVAGLLGAGAGRAYLVSLGAAGAELTTSDGRTAIPALDVEAVDTVGAGDTLNGALAAGLAAGLDLESAARRAVAAASLAVTRAGAREGMPTIVDLEAALG
jgi:ribokinase